MLATTKPRHHSVHQRWPAVIVGLSLTGCAAEGVDEPIEVAQADNSLLYCNRTYTQLAQGIGAPYNAVGYLSNGCTAFLIDDNHIAANAHCFVDQWGSGEWQTNQRYYSDGDGDGQEDHLRLTFYPNFNPSRIVLGTDGKPLPLPRASVLRAVVGARSSRGSADASETDWGIARLNSWQDASGVNLTPINLATSVPTGTNLSVPITSPAYNRHHFPFNDTASPHWDDMMRDLIGTTPDSTCFSPMWIVKPGTPPKGERNACNERWAAGYIHGGCNLRQNLNDVLQHGCDVHGGSSGSPILGQSNGQWVAYGITRGWSSPDFSADERPCVEHPVCYDEPQCVTYQADDYNNMNAGPSTKRFLHAPRFANDVAVFTRANNPLATAVYAIDGDRNIVVTRARLGGAPSQGEPFDYWSSLGTPGSGMVLDDIAACSQNGGFPQIFVTADGEIRQRSVSNVGTWNSWGTFSLPAGETTVYDIDTAKDGNGWCQLFAVMRGGLYTRTKTSDTAWGSWARIGAANTTYRKVSALVYDNKRNAAVVDRSGNIWRASSPLTTTSWSSSLSQVSHPGRSFVDIDFTLDEFGRGFLLGATQTVGTDGQLVFTPLYGSGAWTNFTWFQTSLFPYFETKGPNGIPIRPTIKRINAGLWAEGPAGTYSPVVFGTDDQGNVYFIEYTRFGTGAPGWVLEWKSFYHERIPYLYACSDGFDNDSDFITDYPRDSGCTGPFDNTE